MLSPKLNYFSPKSTDELAGILADHRGNARILAGGTDIIPNMLSKLYKVDYLVDIGGIKALQGISYKAGKGLVIGAAAKMKAIERSSIIRERFTALHRAASEVGSPQVRAMATIGGNSCNASPAADTPPALTALGASVTLAGKAGKRELPIEAFILGNRLTDLKPGEFLESFFLPDPPRRSASRFGLITLRQAVEIDVASLAVFLALDGSGKVTGCRIAMGSVAPVPLRAKEAESILVGQSLDDKRIEAAATICAEESKPIDDIRASAAYRRRLIKVLAYRTVTETLAAIR